MSKNRSKLLLAILALASLLSLSAGEVETATYCDTLIFSGSSLEDNHTLPLFDPGLGNLVGVNLATDLGVLQNFSLENEQPDGKTIGAESEAMLEITIPDGSSIVVNTSSSISEELAAYDGETDFEGPSGKAIEGVESKSSAEREYLELSDFVASFQNETVSLPVAVSIVSASRGNIVLSLSTVAESRICVTYTYEPFGSVREGESK
jgi:hypothetical protein